MSHEAAEGILIEACKISQLSPKDLRARNRARPIVRTRQACAYAIKRRTSWTTPKIARFLGLSDHTTVRHCIKIAQKLIVEDPAFASIVCSLMWAPVAIPLSSQDLQAQVKFKPPAPTNRQIRNGAQKPPKPPKPILEIVYLDGSYFTIDEDGDCATARNQKRRIIKGSKRLAKAILSARKVAA